MKLRNALFVVFLVVLIFFTSCATPNYSNKIKIEKYKEELSFHTAEQDAYLAGEYKDIKRYANGTEEKSKPQPIILSWTDSLKAPTDEYVVLISENKDLTNSKMYKTEDTYIDIYNLYAGTKYYFSVTATVNGDVVGVSSTGNFTTQGAPRNLYIDGVTNARDMGGYKTSDGGYVKQGLIYRTAKLNKNKTMSVTPLITSIGIRTMVEDLGIKTEVDLRGVDSNEIGKLTGSLLGNGVKYINCPMSDAFPIFKKANFESIKAVFDVLADESNYPLFYHCSIGTDRTGLIAVLVYNLLGVSEEDIYKDYLLSNFANISSSRLVSQCQAYYVGLDDYAGENYYEKTRNFLLSIGVTDEQIDSVINILKEK